MPINFDVQAARSHGYTDTQIADAIAQKAGFDVTGAREAGHQDLDIITHLTGAPARPRAVPVDVDAHVADALKTQAEGMSTREAVETGAGRTFDMIGKGLQQMYYGATGNQPELDALKSRADHNKALYAPIQEAHPVATAVGESAPSLVIPGAGAGATALGAAGKLALGSAIPAALEYGTVEERAQKAALAGGGAAVGGVVIPKAIGGLFNVAKGTLKGMAGNITAEALALANHAKALGIPVNVAQLGDSKFLKTLSSVLEQMPFSGGSKTAAAQKEAYTRAVANTFGEDAGKITPEVYAAAKARLGNEFNELAARNNLDVTSGLKSKLAGIFTDAQSTASDDTVRAVKNIMERVTKQGESKGGHTPAKLSNVLDASGNPIVIQAATDTPISTKLAGSVYSSIDSELSNIIKAGGEKGLYAKRLQTAIREGMDTSISAADQAAWNQTRGQYKNLKAVRSIVAKDMADGNVPPSQLMNALNSTDAGKEAMAMGTRGTLGELGRIGKEFVRDAVPNSGTAQRGMAMGIIGGGGYAFGADPLTIAGMMAGGATTGRLLNKVLNSPKTVAALTARGIPLKDLMKLPPDKLTQVLGSTIGMTATNQLREE
jgi:hypothetical protein